MNLIFETPTCASDNYMNEREGFFDHPIKYKKIFRISFLPLPEKNSREYAKVSVRRRILPLR
jgi:hypothetical protein